MVFSSVLFLFLFFPIALAGYYLVPTLRGKNLWLLLASLWFYAWGEFRYLPLLGSSIAINFAFGLLVARFPKGGRTRFLALGLAVATNLEFHYGLVNWFIGQNRNRRTPALVGRYPDKPYFTKLS